MPTFEIKPNLLNYANKNNNESIETMPNCKQGLNNCGIIKNKEILKTSNDNSNIGMIELKKNKKSLCVNASKPAKCTNRPNDKRLQKNINEKIKKINCKKNFVCYICQQPFQFNFSLNRNFWKHIDKKYISF